MRQAALLRSDKGLGTPGTDRKKAKPAVTSVKAAPPVETAIDDRKDHFVVRNGVRWHHFDPTKWWVWTLARLGHAWNLRRAPRARIASARVLRRN